VVEQPIRNRQVASSTLALGSNLFQQLSDQLTETCCTSVAQAILCSSRFIASVTTLGTVLM
jgi:hypothetical protein